MQRPQLVLLRWHGDVVASFDALEPALPFLTAPAPGVDVEIYDVSEERASLRLRPRVDARPIAGFLASAALHVVVGAAALGLFSFAEHYHDARDADVHEQPGATLPDPLTRIATNENAAETPEDERPPPVPTEADLGLSPQTSEEVERGVVVAHGSAGSDVASTSPAVCAPPQAGAGRGPKCRRSVVITAMSTRPGCFVDTVGKAGETGTLTYPCEGDGEATLTFGTRSFAGGATGGRVEMCTGTEYPWSDGCTWTSAQRVTGSIASGTLAFAYAEAPKPGQGACAAACEAHGTVRLENGSWRDTAR